jgi:hypothetical protein
MKKSSYLAALALIGVVMSGCPVYDGNDDGCFDDFDCPYGYVCDGHSGLCVTDIDSSRSCAAPDDCGTNETCGRSGKCMDGDCHFASVGWVKGYECSSASGRWECITQGSGVSGSGGAPMSSDGEPSNDGGEPMSSGGAPEPSSSAGAGG